MLKGLYLAGNKLLLLLNALIDIIISEVLGDIINLNSYKFEK